MAKKPSKAELAWLKSMGNAAHRSDLAQKFLVAMIASPPQCDRSKVDKKKWARIAFDWADAFMSVDRWMK